MWGRLSSLLSDGRCAARPLSGSFSDSSIPSLLFKTHHKGRVNKRPTQSNQTGARSENNERFIVFGLKSLKKDSSYDALGDDPFTSDVMM